MERLTKIFFLLGVLFFIATLIFVNELQGTHLEMIKISFYFISSLFLFQAFLNTTSWLRTMVLLLLLSALLMLTYHSAYFEGYDEEVLDFFILILTLAFSSTVLVMIMNFEPFEEPVSPLFWVVAAFIMTLAISADGLDSLLEGVAVVAGTYLLFSYRDVWFLNALIAFVLLIMLDFSTNILVAHNILPMEASLAGDVLISFGAVLFSANLWWRSKKVAELRQKAIAVVG